MKKLALFSATVLAAVALGTKASADETRDQIEAQGNQQIQYYWDQYQQGLQERQQAWEQGQGDRFSDAYITADAKAGAMYQEWLRAQTRLGDELHNYDVSQYEKQGSQEPQTGQQSETPASETQAIANKPTQAKDAKQVEATATQQTANSTPTQQATVKSTAQASQEASAEPLATKTVTSPSKASTPTRVIPEAKAVKAVKSELPQTGNSESALAVLIGTLLALFGLGAIAYKPKKVKNDEEQD